MSDLEQCDKVARKIKDLYNAHQPDFKRLNLPHAQISISIDDFDRGFNNPDIDFELLECLKAKGIGLTITRGRVFMIVNH